MSTKNVSEKSEDLEFVVNHRHFVTGIVSILDMLKDKSVEVCDEKSKKAKYHKDLQNACDKILKQYRKTSEEHEQLDEGKIIKKIYKILSSNIDMLMEKDGNLFTIKDQAKRIVTIIPTVNIALVYGLFDEDERKKFWQYLYLLFIASAKMVHSANKEKSKSEKLSKLMENVEKLEKELTKTGLTIKGMLFNPFIGIGSDKDTSNYGVNELYSGEGVSASGIPGLDINMVLQQLGVSDTVDMDKLNEQLKNITEDDITDATKNITKILGADNDPEVADVCNTLVRSIVENLRDNGVNDMIGTLTSITESVGKTIDPAKMKKTAASMNSFMSNSESKLRNMTDEKGNNIGEKLYQTMGTPLKMAQAMGQGMPIPGMNMPQQKRSGSEKTDDSVSKKNNKGKSKDKSNVTVKKNTE
jgi:ribosomal protein L12E/L44/L45/RPP1/RPP2